MLTVRKAAQRGHANFGWLDSRHSFSFGSYHDPAHMGFSDLRVINQDVVAPGAGFPRHGHRDMEILTYVLKGAVAHADSMGNRETVRAGELQRMTAGTGVEHSEFNASATEPTEFLQIWVLPERRGLTPGYEQVTLDSVRTGAGWQVIASRNPDTLFAERPGAERTGAERPGAVTVHQDLTLHAGRFGAGDTTRLPLARGRSGWLQLIEGRVSVAGVTLEAGDGLALEAVDQPEMQALSAAHALLFDLRP